MSLRTIVTVAILFVFFAYGGARAAERNGGTAGKQPSAANDGSPGVQPTTPPSAAEPATAGAATGIGGENLSGNLCANRLGIPDDVLSLHVREALHAVPSLADNPIYVREVHDGHVRLDGEVDNLNEHLRAIEAVHAVPGVCEVLSDIHSNDCDCAASAGGGARDE